MWWAPVSCTLTALVVRPCKCCSSAPIGSLVYYGVSVRCVRAREERAIPLLIWFEFFDLWRGIGRVRGIQVGASSVSGLFSNPPEAELFPVIFRRFPRRNRSATGCVSLACRDFSVTHFPLAGSAGSSRMLAARIGPRILVMGTWWLASGVASRGARVDERPESGFSVRCVRSPKDRQSLFV